MNSPKQVWFEIPEFEEEVIVVRRYKPKKVYFPTNGQLCLPPHKEPKRLPPYIPSPEEIIPDFLRTKLRVFVWN